MGGLSLTDFIDYFVVAAGCKRMIISLFEAVLWVGLGTPHRLLRSLCVVLTINQPLGGFAIVTHSWIMAVLTQIPIKLGTDLHIIVLIRAMFVLSVFFI